MCDPKLISQALSWLSSLIEHTSLKFFLILSLGDDKGWSGCLVWKTSKFTGLNWTQT